VLTKGTRGTFSKFPEDYNISMSLQISPSVIRSASILENVSTPIFLHFRHDLIRNQCDTWISSATACASSTCSALPKIVPGHHRQQPHLPTKCSTATASLKCVSSYPIKNWFLKIVPRFIFSLHLVTRSIYTFIFSNMCHVRVPMSSVIQCSTQN